MTKKERIGFVFEYRWFDVLSKQTDEMRLRMYDAIFAYACKNEVLELPKDCEIAFEFIKQDIDKNNAAYVEMCEKRQKNIQEYWDKLKNTNEYTCIQMNTSATDCDNDNDCDNDINKKESTKVLKKEKKTTKTAFKKPTLEEVKAYIKQMNYTYTDAEKLYDFYECKNWFVGKNKMKDWKAAVRNWERTDKERAGRKPRTAPVTTRTIEHPLKHEVVVDDTFREFRKWQWENIPRLMNRQPYFDDYITFNQYCALIKRFNPEETDEGCAKAYQKLKDILLMIENRPDTYEQRYTSLYATVVTWAAREK